MVKTRWNCFMLWGNKPPAEFIISPSDDASVRSDTGTTNYWTNTGLIIWWWANIHLFWIKFNIDSLPWNVSSAKLYMYRSSNQATPLTSTRWNRITSSWSEWTVTYNTRPWGMSNNTWTLVNIPWIWNWFELDITTLYNQWKDWTYTNYWIAFNWNASSYTSAVTRFASKEYTADETKRPYLKVNV